MGFELMFVTQELTLLKWQQIVNCLEASKQLRPVKTDRIIINKTPGVAYAFEAAIRESWPEDFYLSLGRKGFICASTQPLTSSKSTLLMS